MDVEKKVKYWLDKTGFPLEMEADNAFRKSGFDVRQLSVYLDPQSKKNREIDIIASDPDFFGIIEAAFVIECKSTDKPWLVLTADDAYSGIGIIAKFAVNGT